MVAPFWCILSNDHSLTGMKYFLQAVKEASRFWPYLVGAFLCSLGVATLWGANIAALFPVIEVTLSGQSLQQWSETNLEETRQALVLHQQQLAEVEAELRVAAPEEQPLLELQSSKLAADIEVDESKIASARWMQNKLARWMPDTPFKTIAYVVGFVFVGTVLRVVLALVNVLLIGWVSESVVRDIRSRVFSKALELDPANFECYGVSGIQAYITHTADMLAQGITSVLSGAVTEPLRIASCLIGASIISWRLTLASLILAPIAVVLSVLLNRSVRALSTRMLDRSMQLYHIALDVLGAHHAVQSNTMESFEKRRFHTAAGEMRKMALRARLYQALASPLTELLGIGILCVGLLASSYLVLNQETAIFGITLTESPLSVSGVTVFLGMLVGAADPLRKLARVISGINSGMAAANIIYPLLDRQHWIRDPESDPQVLDKMETIEFRDVSFSYDRIKDALREVNITIRKHDRVAIVGSNGSGKSTLVNLLCRYYDTKRGQVLINGIPAQSYRLKDLRSKFAIVSQRAELFNESVLHNIRYGRWDASEEEVIAAAKLARADEFISELPDTYQTIIGSNGHRLSGGQRQRLALARAFLRDAEVLILDEATSQIDVESERLILDALADYGNNRTLIFVTHRESNLTLATRVVRMDAGRASEVDTLSHSAA